MSLPPRIKVLEAAGCIADGRLRILEKNSSITAEVVSSTGERKYLVVVELEKKKAYSSDNGTKHRGYVGYPIIALLMKLGLLPFDEEVASSLKGIPWKVLNEKYKRYWIVEKEVKKVARSKGLDASRLDLFIKEVLGELKEIGLSYDESLLRPDLKGFLEG